MNRFLSGCLGIILFPGLLCSLASCTHEEEAMPVETEAPETVLEDVFVSFTSAPLDTRTMFIGQDASGSYPTRWTESDTDIYISMNYMTPTLAGVTRSDDSRSASFGAVFPYTAGSCVFYSLSPSAAAEGISPSRSAWAVNIPEDQSPLASSCDERGQIIAAVSSTYDSTPDKVSLHFKHVTSYMRLTLENFEAACVSNALSGATVSSIDLTFGTPVAGSWYYYLGGSDGHSAGSVETKEPSSTITIHTSSVTDVWVALAPVELTGKTLKVTVNTDKGSIARTLTYPERTLISGNIYTVSVDMSSAASVAQVSGDAPVLQESEYGAYLSSVSYVYSEGSDQTSVMEESDSKVEFTILHFAEGQVATTSMSGIPSGATKGDSFDLSFQRAVGLDVPTAGSYSVTVVKESGAKLWLATADGQGFIVKR